MSSTLFLIGLLIFIGFFSLLAAFSVESHYPTYSGPPIEETIFTFAMNCFAPFNTPYSPFFFIINLGYLFFMSLCLIYVIRDDQNRRFFVFAGLLLISVGLVFATINTIKQYNASKAYGEGIHREMVNLLNDVSDSSSEKYPIDYDLYVNASKLIEMKNFREAKAICEHINPNATFDKKSYQDGVGFIRDECLYVVSEKETWD